MRIEPRIVMRSKASTGIHTDPPERNGLADRHAPLIPRIRGHTRASIEARIVTGALDEVARRIVTGRLRSAGIEIDGNRPHDLRVLDPRFYSAALLRGSLGFGDAYVDRWWECERIDDLVARILESGSAATCRRASFDLRTGLLSRLSNRQRDKRGHRLASAHYERSHELFRTMLDRRLVYSCAYWKEKDTLDDAQEAKLDLVCRKLHLVPGLRVLDIGCGWGSFARFAAERYGVVVVGITISKEQAAFARKECSGLPVEIRLADYAKVREPFDRIVSIGMLEHVGYKNYRRYMAVTRRCLGDRGLMLLQVIGSNRSTTHIDPWIDRHVFPGAMLPSIRQLAAAIEPSFVVEDWHNFGTDYDRTLRAWHARFEAGWPDRGTAQDERFRRMWRFYLLSCAGAFRARHIQLWQIVLSPRGVPGGYAASR